MSDISKKKEDAKKEIRSLLLSAPVGLTLAELERDYNLYIGNKLPTRELGYFSTEQFLQDIPDTVQMTYKNGTLVLTGVPDVTTKHIEKLVSKQRLDANKHWGTLKIPTATASFPSRHKTDLNMWHSSPCSGYQGGRSFNSSPDEGWRHHTVHSPRDSWHEELRSDSHHRTQTSLLGSPYAGPCSYTQNPLFGGFQHAEPHSHMFGRNPNISPLRGGVRHTDPHSNTFHRNGRTGLLSDIHHAEPRSYFHHRNVGTVPLLVRNQVDTIVTTYPGGIPLIHFLNIYRKHHGCNLDFWKLGFSSLYGFLSSLEDIVSLKPSSTGETWVTKKKNFNGYLFYNGPMDNHRPALEIIHRTDRVPSPRSRTIQTGKSLLDASPGTEKTNDAQWKTRGCRFTPDVETADYLSTQPTVAHRSLSSQSDETNSLPASRSDQAPDLPKSQVDEAPDSPKSQVDEAPNSPKSQVDESHSSADLHLVSTSCDIPLVVQDRIRQIMTQRPNGLYASRLPFEYRSVFKEELPLKMLGYASVVEFANQMPHVIKVERPHPQGDWHLLPANVQTPAVIAESSDRILTTSPDTRRGKSAIRTEESTRESVAQAPGIQDIQLPREDIDGAHKDDSVETGCASANMDSGSNGTGSSVVLSASMLEQALSTLEAKRKRLLKRIILENYCSPESIDELTDIEENIRRVGTRISQLQNNPAETIDLQPLTCDLKEQLNQASVTELESSKPTVQNKSMQKVAPMRRDSLSQKQPAIEPVDMSAQTLLDMSSLLREQILLNQLLMERLSLSQETLTSKLPAHSVTQGAGSLQSLCQPLSQSGQLLSFPSYQPLIGNLTVNLLNSDSLLGSYNRGSMLPQSPWPQASAMLQPLQGLEQLKHLLQISQLPTFPASASNSELTTLNRGQILPATSQNGTGSNKDSQTL